MSIRKIVTVDASVMSCDPLFIQAESSSAGQITKVQKSFDGIASERIAFEAVQERKLAQGQIVVGQSNDIKFVERMMENRAVATFLYCTKTDPRALIFPQSKEGGKSSTETSNLKGYNKIRQLMELIFTGRSDCENVAKVIAVACFKLQSAQPDRVFTRDEIETLLSSYDVRKRITQGTADFLKAVDEVADLQAKQMTGGKQTQASQMVRALVALGCAEDVRDGRAKNTVFKVDALPYRALMRRFGQLPEQIAA